MSPPRAAKARELDFLSKYPASEMDPSMEEDRHVEAEKKLTLQYRQELNQKEKSTTKSVFKLGTAVTRA